MKKFEGVKALCFVSIISAICLILVLFTTFTSGIGITLMLVLPLCGTLVTLCVNYKYSLIYIVATLLMSLINVQLAIFVVLPCLISGFTFGILIKKYIQGYYIIAINAIILLLLEIGSTYLIRVFYDIDMINSIGTLLKLNDVGFHKIYFLFLLSISLIETSLSYVIITNELKKFSYEFNEKMNQFIQIIIIEAILISLSIILIPYIEILAYLINGLSFYFGVVLGYYIFSYYKHKRMLFIQIPLYLISIVGIGILYSLAPKNYLPTLFLLIPGSEIISSLYIIIYQLLYKKSYINESIFD